MSRFRVLLLAPPGRLPRDFPDRLFRDSGREIVAEAVEAVPSALARLGRQGYDAALCWVDRTDDLAGLSRIREANPELPILVLTAASDDPEFDERASRAGATRTAHLARDGGALSEGIRRIVESGELQRELPEQGRGGRPNAIGAHARGEGSESPVGIAPRPVREPPRARLPILVEDEPDEARLLLRAFQAAGVAARPLVFATADDAVAFLSDEGLYRDLDPVQPFSFALLDVRLPGKPALDLLEWMGRAPKLVHVPVTLLSGSSDPEFVHRAFRRGAKSYLIKPVGFEPLVRLVEGVHRFWSGSDWAAGD